MPAPRRKKKRLLSNEERSEAFLGLVEQALYDGVPDDLPEETDEWSESYGSPYDDEEEDDQEERMKLMDSFFSEWERLPENQRNAIDAVLKYAEDSMYSSKTRAPSINHSDLRAAGSDLLQHPVNDVDPLIKEVLEQRIEDGSNMPAAETSQRARLARRRRSF